MHVPQPGSIVEEELNDESVQAEPSASQQPPAPQKRTPLWDDIEADQRYQSVRPEQQSAMRARYWDTIVSPSPKAQTINPDKLENARTKFVNKPLEPPPDSLYTKVKKAVVGGIREEATIAEAIANITSEAIGGTLAAGMAGVGTLVHGALKRRTDLIPQTYETIRDTLRDFFVFQPQTEEGKRKAAAIGEVAAYPFVKADEFLAKAQENIYATLEPQLGSEEAAQVAVSLTAGLRGTAIFALTTLGGGRRRRGQPEAEPPILPDEIIPPPPELKGLPGPPVRPMLEGPDPFRMPGEVQPRVGGPAPPAGLLEGPSIWEMPDAPRRAGDPFNMPGPKEPLLLEGPKGARGEPDVKVPTPETTGGPTPGVALTERLEPRRPVQTPVQEMTIEQLRQALMTDELTGLPNRLAYTEAPKRGVQAFADLDGLGYVNDNFGHGAGDVFIQAYGQLFKEAGLDAYRAGRGADEIVVQFDRSGAAYKALNQARERLQNAIIQYTTPSGEVKEFKGLSFSYGVGRTIEQADVALRTNKQQRTEKGLRAVKGARPPGLAEVARQPTERRGVPGKTATDAYAQAAEATTVVPLMAQGTAPQALSPGIGLPESAAPSQASGGAVPLWVQYVDRLRAETPPETSIVAKTNMDRVTEHIAREESKQTGLGPTEPAIVETGLDRTPLAGAEPTVGLGVRELERQTPEAKTNPSAETSAFGGDIHLYSGLPLDQAMALVKWAQKQVSTRARVGQDLSLLQLGLKGLLSPTFLSKIHPLAEQLVTYNQMLRHRDYYAGVERGVAEYKSLTKGLTKQEKQTVGQLLDTYRDSREIPVETLNARRDITPQVLTAMDGIRHKILEPTWQKFGGREGGPPKVHAYFTRLYESGGAGLPKDLQGQAIRSFAEENGLDFVEASTILGGRIPDRGFFGPLSMSRTGAEKPSRVWDLDRVMTYYIAGSAKKGYLDQLLPVAKEILTQIDQPAIQSMLRDYIDRQRGLPVTQWRARMRANPFISQASRYEALHQYISKLGLRPVLTVLNSTQYGIFDGTKALHAALSERSTGPIADFVKGATGMLTARGQAIVRESGVMTGQGGAWAPDVKAPLDVLNKLASVTGFFHNAVDRYSRAAAYLRNYEAAERAIRGMPEGAMTPEQATEFKQMAGYKGVAETQFFYDVSGSPSALGNPIIANQLRFRQYMLQSIGYIANLKGTELLLFLGVLSMVGGPDAIPGLRQWYAELRRSHPDAPITRVLAGWQDMSIAGVAGVDVGYALGFGFIPGSSVDSDLLQKFQDDFWGTVGAEVGGPSVRDIQNLYKDATTGYIDLEHPDMKSIMGSRSFGTVSVTAQQAMRSLKEREQRYIEYGRGRPGPPLSDHDITLRGFGFTSQDVARRAQEYAQWRVDVDNAITQKHLIEDRYVRWRKRIAEAGYFTDALRGELTDITNAQVSFNRTHRNHVGLQVTGQSMSEAYAMSRRPLSERVVRSRLQRRLLRERLDPYKPKDRQALEPLPGEDR